MGKCETCEHFVTQAVVDRKLHDGRIFKGTPLEQKGYNISPLCGCLFFKVIWSRGVKVKKPYKKQCEYKNRSVEK